MRVLVTGGTGFLGAATARALADAGCEAVVTDREARAGALACDVGDTAAVRDLIARVQPEAVVHLAAVLTPESRADVIAAVRVNALGAANVFAAALGAEVRRIVYAGSIAGLGAADLRAGDAAVPRPGSIYGATKAFAEHLATALATEHPQAVIVGLRYGWVYGPGRERGWRDIQAVIEAAAAGDSPVRFPDVEEPIDWTWVEDAAAVTTRAVVAPITPGHTVLNVAGDKRRVREAIDVLRRLSPATRFEAVPTTTPPTAWAFANDRLERLLGVAPHTPMEEGVRRLWDRARAGTAE